MRDVPYSAWATFVASHLPAAAGVILDLFSGDGSFAAALRTQGFTAIGLDTSFAMLQQGDGLRLQADVRSLPVRAGSADAATATNCSVNYLASLSELGIFFSECARILVPGGILIFDYCSENRAWALSTRLFSALDGAVVFRHRYASESASLVSTVTIKCAKTPPAMEIHSQKIFSRPEIEAQLTAAGFLHASFTGNYALPVPSGIAPIMTVVARRG